MEFKITKKSKEKARKRRVRNEKKWLVFRVIKLLLGLAAITSFVIGVYFVKGTDYGKLTTMGFIFSATFVLAVMTEALIVNLTSHWIQDRLNEKLWMDADSLFHFQQVAFAAGLNARHADETGYTFIFSLESVRNVRYDAKSKRLEFIADGKGVHYSDVYRGIVDREWPLNGFEAVFYDYFEPNLKGVLEEMGESVEETTINSYRVLDSSI